MDQRVLRDLLDERAARDPDRLAFADREHRLTFGELAERATARARVLQEMGVAPGDRVAIAMAAGVPFVEVFWALQVIGAAPCAFNPGVPDQTLARRVALVRPKLVVTDALAGAMTLTRGRPSAVGCAPNDLAFLQLTSGTTGAPRASMILQRNVMAYLRSSRTHGFLRSEDVAVCWVPPWHDLGLVGFVIAAVFHGMSCHIVEPAVRTIPQWLETISRVRGTTSAGPDFAFRLAIRMVDPMTVDLSSLRMMTSGGEPVRWSSIRAFEERFDVPGTVVPHYGLGEATLGVTETLPGEPIAVDERGNVSCGFANPGCDVRAGASAASPREISIRGESVFSGYFEAPEATGAALRAGWLHTGDSGYLDGRGRLFILGRREGMIKRAGGLITPRELEEAAEQADGVRMAAAAGAPLGTGGEEVVVVVVEADPSVQRTRDEIAADITREVVQALGFAPGRVIFVPPRSIPRTESGKIRYGRLQTMLQAELRATPPGAMEVSR